MQLKYLFLLSFSVLSLGIFAQTDVKDTTVVKKYVYRAEAGYSQQLRFGSSVSSTPYYNIHLGGTVEFPLQYNFGIQTGLNYNFAFGNKTQYYGNIISNKDNDDYNVKDTVTYSYNNHSVNIPVRLTYNLPIFWGLKLFAYAGPNFNIGLAEPTTVVSTKELYGITSGSYDAYKDNISRFNVQLGAGGGIQWKSYRVKSGYDWGIFNTSKVQNSPQYKRGWTVSFEYEF